MFRVITDRNYYLPPLIWRLQSAMNLEFGIFFVCPATCTKRLADEQRLLLCRYCRGIHSGGHVLLLLSNGMPHAALTRQIPDSSISIHLLRQNARASSSSTKSPKRTSLAVPNAVQNWIKKSYAVEFELAMCRCVVQFTPHKHRRSYSFHTPSFHRTQYTERAHMRFIYGPQHAVCHFSRSHIEPYRKNS